MQNKERDIYGEGAGDKRDATLRQETGEKKVVGGYKTCVFGPLNRTVPVSECFKQATCQLRERRPPSASSSWVVGEPC